ncbi:uncharacterized protein isoform X2 [Leptinotarsa decemlineata]|uniref:uncharacterized protein isoform X2 n=1 Tax=Leptinotarsa decemlineata TaxID=7539 RepID=UPI003D30C33A
MASGFTEVLKRITFEMYTLGVALALALFVSSDAAPGEVAAAGSAQISGSIPKVLSFENGNVGVNFLGFKASAGLGGGLHAEAETPFGQAAGAGLGGYVDEHEGRSAGGLYAGATAGGGISAGAGLEGTAGAKGSFGSSYAGATAGGLTVSKVKTVAKPIVEVELQKEVIAPAVYKKRVEISSAPVVHEIVEEKPQKTYIERTVIPQYEEKTIYVPSYEEKVVRVPTVVEKKVKVAVAPKIVEKTVVKPPADVDFERSVEHVVETAAPPVGVITKTRTKYRTRPLFRKHFFFGGAGGLGGGYGGDYRSNVGSYGGYGGASSFTVSKSGSGQLINDIFNIPISTLGAVNRLVGGLVGGTSGSFSVSKSASLGVGASGY